MTEQTELELLRLAITATSRTQDAFAKHLEMSRQNLNRIIRDAENRKGKLRPAFLKKLQLYKVNIYDWKRNPSLDFYSNDELETMSLAEPETVYGNKLIDVLINDKVELMTKLKQCEKERDALKTQLEENGLLPTKSSRRRSA